MQYQPLFERYGVSLDVVEHTNCDDSTVEKARHADVVINQKCLLRRSLSKKLVAASRKLIFDFDDAIYTRPGRSFGWLTRHRVESRFRYWLGAADVVTVPNDYLAQVAQQTAKDVKIVPMAINTEVWKPVQKRSLDEFHIGWAGAPVNLIHLERLDAVLSGVLRRLPQARLAVFSGKKPNLSCPFEYVPFVPGGEVDFIQRLHVGLLPLPDEEFARGKSPIKAIQYLACGVPVVGNVWGATTEICNLTNGIPVVGMDEWAGALERLASDHKTATLLGMAGREQVLQHHDANVVGEKLWKVIRLMA